MGGSGFLWSSRGLITRKNAATTAPRPRTKSIASMPIISGSFDLCFGGAPPTGGNGALCGRGNGALCGCNGALCACGDGALCGGGWETGGDGKLGAVAEPVGPVCLGNTTVGADAAIVSSKSGSGLLFGLSAAGATGTDWLAEL